MNERLKKQMEFILEIDKEKNIFRQTHLSQHGRNENDAEHAWHMAKERIFSLLPQDQKERLIGLFDEFEAGETAEAKYAKVMDNIQPLILNNSNDGGDWREHGVHAEQVYKRHRKSAEGSRELYEFTDHLLKENIKKGNIKE